MRRWLAAAALIGLVAITPPSVEALSKRCKEAKPQCLQAYKACLASGGKRKACKAAFQACCHGAVGDQVGQRVPASRCDRVDEARMGLVRLGSAG